jgi:hypothetical protein
MSVIPLHLQRRFEQRWAGRFVLPASAAPKSLGLRQTHERMLKTWIEEFDALHHENCYACLTLHPRSD